MSAQDILTKLDEATGIITVLGGEYWYIGVISAVLSAFAAAFGDILIRYSFLNEEKVAEEERRPAYKQPYWILGMIFSILLNPLITLVSYSFAAASVLMPFAGLQIILAILMARVMLKEQIKLLDYFSFFLISFGITVVLAFGAKINEFSSERSEGDIAYIAYNSAIGSLLAVLMFISLPIPPMNSLLTLQKICIAAISGLAGAACNVAAKGGILLVQIAISGDWKKYFSSFLAGNIIVWATMALTQIFYLNWALLKYKATFVIPVVNSVLISVGSIGGVVVYQEKPKSILFFSIGVSLVICGIALLGFSSHDETRCSIRGIRKSESRLKLLQKQMAPSQSTTTVGETVSRSNSMISYQRVSQDEAQV